MAITADTDIKEYNFPSNKDGQNDVGIKEYNFQAEEPEESIWKKGGRYLAQIGKAAPYVGPQAPYVAGYNILMSLAPYMNQTNRMEAAQKLVRRGFLDEKQYDEYVKSIEQGVSESASQTPTFENIYRGIEEKTGLPLTAKTEPQKALGLITAGAVSGPEGAIAKAATGGGAYAISKALQAIGVPENIADNIALVGSSYGSSKVSKKIGSTPSKSESLPIEHQIGTEQIPTKSKYSIFEGVPEFLTEHYAFPEEKIEPVKPPVGYGLRNIQKTSLNLKGKPIGKVEKGGKELPIAKEKINQLGTQYTPAQPNSTPIESIGSKISKYEARDPTIAGKRIKDIVTKKSESKYTDVNKKYAISKKLNENVIDTREDLYEELDEASKEKGALPDFRKDEDVSNKIIKIRDALAKKSIDPETKEVTLDFKPISNQELIDAATNLREYVQYKFAHDPSNAYYKIIDTIENDILRTAESNPKAHKAYAEAKESYKDWAQTYNNDYIRQYTNAQNKNYASLFNDSQKIDNYNQLNKILNNNPTQADIHYDKAIRRKIVEDKLSKFGKDKQQLSESLKNGHFEKALDELGIGLTSQERTSIINEAQAIARKQIQQHIHKQKEAPKTKKIPVREKEWWEGKLPEDIAHKADTVGGVKQLEKIFERTKGGAEKWDPIKLDLGIYRLRNGKIKGPETERSFAKVLEDVENRHYLETTLGKETVEKLDKLANEMEKTKLLTKDKTPLRKTLFNAGKREVLDRVLSGAQLPYEVKKVIIEQMVPRKTNP